MPAEPGSVGAVGRWDVWYRDLPATPQPYGRTVTYQLGAEWLADCALVEDWGCGKGFLRTLISQERYRGLDGTYSRFCDEVVDLTTYRSEVPGVFMRHVLEHNYNWEKVLDNAVASFTERMALIIFTPRVERTHQLSFCEEIGVPDIAFRDDDLTARFGCTWTMQELATQTYFGVERIFFLER